MSNKSNRNALRFIRDRKGAVSIPFVVATIPVIMAAGAGIDLGRAVMANNNLQAAVDAGLLSVATMTGSDTDKKAAADKIVLAALKGTTATTQLTTNGDGTVSYSANYDMPTIFTPFLVPTVRINRSATAKGATAAIAATAGTNGWTDDSCILTLGEDMNLDSDNIMTWNGSPSVQLTGCSLRSNRSMKCNGGTTGAAASYAHGTISGSCPNPSAGQPEVPDTYAAYQTSVTTLCGTTKTGYTWSPTNGSLPAASSVVKYPASQPADYRMIHICGNLTLSGTKTLFANAAGGTEPDKDTIVVIENGSLILGDDAAITAKRTTFILNGRNQDVGEAGKPIIIWPTGSGNSADLIITPSKHADNPFRGFSVYVDPDSNDDQSWKPGANARFDGILYMPKAKLTLSGNMRYGAAECLKIVTAQFTLNGNVALQLKQSASACSAINLRPYQAEATNGTAAQAATFTRLTR